MKKMDSKKFTFANGQHSGSIPFEWGHQEEVFTDAKDHWKADSTCSKSIKEYANA